ncbi:MAG: UDP-N-acetylmuramate dehydrogenase [Cyclobacteriaceae bacterium]
MKIQENISLKEFNTFGIDKKARYFVRVQREADVINAIKMSKRLNVPLFILGGGSNLLFTTNLDYFVVKIDIQGIVPIHEDDQSVYVKVGAGVIWHQLVTHAISKNWAGIENLSLIPGTVGAAPMQNIGAYGAEIKDVFHQLEAIRIDSGSTELFSKEDCGFGYRDSIFKKSHKDQYVITQVTFKLEKTPSVNISYGDIKGTLDKLGLQPDHIKSVSDAVIYIRQQKLPDPKKIGNAGSFFKNPTLSESTFALLKNSYPEIPGYPVDDGIKIPAAWLIERSGWKGKRLGAIGVHENQPLVLVNYGGSDGNDILELSAKIQRDIKKKFGVFLEREVNVI